MDDSDLITGPGPVLFDSGGALLERERVATTAVRFLKRVRAGQGAALFVVGDAGLGKTSVLDRVCALAGEDFRIGSGRGDVMEASLPFCLFDQAVEALGGRGLMEQGHSGPESMNTSAARHYQVLRWVQEQAAKPVLLVFDDLHWADPDSLSLISFICRRIGTMPVAVIGALRPWPSAACEMSSRLVHDGCAWTERLAPLSPSAARALLGARLGDDVAPEIVDRACAVSAGNPLLLEQVALAIDCGDHVPDRMAGPVPEHLLDPMADSLTGVLSEFLLPRFAGLPESAMRVAQTASVFGTRFEPMLAAEVTGLGEDDADVALDALWRCGLVRQESENLLEFVHPLFAQSLYDDLAPPVRRRLHGRAFRALAARGMETEAAEHAIRGHLIGDPQAVGVVERTGMTALRAGALVAASRHLGAAAELAGTTAGVGLLLALGQALLAAGQSCHATEVYLKILARDGLGSAERANALRMLGRTYFAMGDFDRAAAHFEESASVGYDVDPAVAAAALLDEAQAAMPMAGPAASLPLAVRARDLSRGAADDARRRAEVAWAYIALQAGDADGLSACAAAARAVESDPLAELSDLCWTWGVLDTYGMVAIAVEQFAEAERVLTTALRIADQVGAVEAAAALELCHAVLRYRTGPLDQALAHARKAASWADLVPMIESFARAGEAAALLQSGLVAESLACCDDIEPRATLRAEGLALLWIWHIRAQVHLREGRLPAACELYGQAEELTDRMGFGDPGMVPLARHAIAAYVWSDRPDDAIRLIERLEGCTLPGRWPRIAAHTGRAWLAERRSDLDAAIEHFEAALTLHDEVDLPLEQAATLVFYGSFLRRGGWPTRARPVLARALCETESLGAGWLREQAREELTVAGGRRRRAGGSSVGLTGQEQRVARLAATGATNREIARSLSLSVKTIEFHLQRIYNKLGIASRRQLIAMTGGGEFGALPWQELVADAKH